MFSRGWATRAQQIAERTRRTIEWLSGMVNMPPIPPLFVLNAKDCPHPALIPHYGLAHVNRLRIVVGQELRPFFDRIIDRLRPKLSDSSLSRLAGVYGDPLDFSPFADLLVCHELTHLADRPSQLDRGQHANRGQASPCPVVLRALR